MEFASNFQYQIIIFYDDRLSLIEQRNARLTISAAYAPHRNGVRKTVDIWLI